MSQQISEKSPPGADHDAQGEGSKVKEKQSMEEGIKVLEALDSGAAVKDGAQMEEKRDDEEHEKPDETKEAPKAPYSVFSNRTKWLIVILAAMASVFTPLGSNVYFPAIPTLASAFHVSIQDIK